MTGMRLVSTAAGAAAALVITGLAFTPARGDSPCPAKAYAVQTASATYGADTTFEALDLYTPTGLKGEPIVVFVHGGGWTRGDKSQYRSLGQAFAACGVALAAVNYLLAPQANADAQATDIDRAVKWAIDNAGLKGFSSTRIYLMGHGSGAELAVLAAVDPRTLAAAGLSPTAVAGVIAMDGMGYDPSGRASDAAANPARYRSYAAAFGADPKQWQQYDCSQFFKGTLPRFLVVHGVDDYLAPESQSAQLVDELTRAHAQVSYVQPDARDQDDVLVDLVRVPDDPTFAAIARFVGQNVAQLELQDVVLERSSSSSF